MHVIRQYDPRINVKRTLAFYRRYRLTQAIYIIHQQRLFTIQQIHRKKISPTRHIIQPIHRHKNLPANNNSHVGWKSAATSDTKTSKPRTNHEKYRKSNENMLTQNQKMSEVAALFQPTIIPSEIPMNN